MNTKVNKLVSATAAAFLLAGTSAFFAASADPVAKKADRLPLASATATENVCEDNILGSITDECVFNVVETTTVKKVQTTTVEWRDENNATSTLVRAPVVSVAKAEEAPQN